MSIVIKNPRAIINRRIIEQNIAALSPDMAAGDRRALLLSWLKSAYQAGAAEIRRRFERANAENDLPDYGQMAASSTAYLTDQILRIIYDEAALRLYPAANPTAQDHMSLIAVGGYGRFEMAPYSDIDLLFLVPWKPTPHCEQIIEHMIYMLWDMGLKLGHAVRGIDHCLNLARSDSSIRAAILDARYVWGAPQIFADFRRQFDLILQADGAEFAREKWGERKRRHEKMDDSRYVLEPNIKEGIGGLRDMQTLIWVARFAWRIESATDLVDRNILTHSEARQFDKAYEFLWKLRFHLHYLAGRAEERIIFDLQPELARRLHYTDRQSGKGVERFMKFYFLVARWVGELGRIIEASLINANQPDFTPKINLPPVPDSDEARRRGKTATALSEVFARFKFRRRTVLPPEAEAQQLTTHGLKRDQGYLVIHDGEKFIADPLNLLRIFYLAGIVGDAIHPSSMRQIQRTARDLSVAAAQIWRNDLAANRFFVQILTSRQSPEKILRLMNDADVLGKFIPDFARIVAQMQYDRYHVFTVDEHSIYAIGILNRIEQGELTEELPLATSIMKQISARDALYVAVFLHDIAKGRQGDHSILGEAVANELCPRFGLTAEESETVAWLVRQHLLMSNTAFRRDVQDPKTVSDFVALVQSPQRLKLLLVLTVVDIRAVGPKVWNNWKASLLRQLYAAALELMLGEEFSETAPNQAKLANENDTDVTNAQSTDPAQSVTHHKLAALQMDVRAQLPEFDERDFDSYWQMVAAAPAYLRSTPIDVLARHARLIKEATSDHREKTESDLEKTETKIDWYQDSARGISEVTIFTQDQAGLFARLAGAFAASGVSIVDARIFTLNNSMILDSFAVQSTEGAIIDRPATIKRINGRIAQALTLELAELKLLVAEQAKNRQDKAPLSTTPRVLIDNKASSSFTVIEINGHDRTGLLFDICAQLTEHNLRIGAAKIATYGERVVDVFYVKNLFGLKIDQPDQIESLRQTILPILNQNDGHS